MDTLCTNKVAANIPRIRIHYYHKNHWFFFSKLILKCEICIESLISPTFFDCLIFESGPRPLRTLIPQMSAITLGLQFQMTVIAE